MSDPHRVERKRALELSPLLGLLKKISHSFFEHSLIPPFHLATLVLHRVFLTHTLVIVIALHNAQFVFPYLIVLVLDIKYVRVLILGLASIRTFVLFLLFSPDLCSTNFDM